MPIQISTSITSLTKGNNKIPLMSFDTSQYMLTPTLISSPLDPHSRQGRLRLGVSLSTPFGISLDCWRMLLTRASILIAACLRQPGGCRRGGGGRRECTHTGKCLAACMCRELTRSLSTHVRASEYAMYPRWPQKKA
jgi:hypothetical protein